MVWVVKDNSVLYYLISNLLEYVLEISKCNVKATTNGYVARIVGMRLGVPVGTDLQHVEHCLLPQEAVGGGRQTSQITSEVLTS